MEWTFGLIGLLLGALITGAIAFLALGRQRAESLKKQEEIVTQLDAQRNETQRAQVLNATMEAELKGLTEVKQELDSARNELVDLTAKRSALEGQLAEQQRAYENWKVERAELENKLKEEFQGLASEALRKNNTTFLELANEKLKEGDKDLEKRQESIANLVKPIAESLQKVDAQVKEIEKEREGAYKGLLSQVDLLRTQSERLNKETTTLAQALKGSSTRGRWGEIQLKRIAEIHGMLEYCDFVLQSSAADDEGKRIRPDMIVKLPNSRYLVVDSKVPLDDLLDSGEADDEQTLRDKVAELSKRVKGHVTTLRSRSYTDLPQAPDFVVMFIPSPRLLDLALEGDPSLLEFAYERDVVLATASTLMAVMRSVAYVWKQDKLAQEAVRIADEGRKLHKAVADFVDNFETVGKSLESASKKFDTARSHLRRRILPGVARLEELGASSGKPIQGIEVGFLDEAIIEMPGPPDALFALESSQELNEEE